MGAETTGRFPHEQVRGQPTSAVLREGRRRESTRRRRDGRSECPVRYRPSLPCSRGRGRVRRASGRPTGRGSPQQPRRRGPAAASRRGGSAGLLDLLGTRRYRHRDGHASAVPAARRLPTRRREPSRAHSRPGGPRHEPGDRAEVPSKHRREWRTRDPASRSRQGSATGLRCAARKGLIVTDGEPGGGGLIPPALEHRIRSYHASTGPDWLQRLPGLIASCVSEWDLTLLPAFESGGDASWTAP